MSAEDIFRNATVCSPGAWAADSGTPQGSFGKLSEEINAVLREGSKCRHFEADYTNPAGLKLRIAVTISPVPASDGTLLGTACLLNDLSEFKRIRDQQQLQGEISAEMALDLRTSLATISGYAQQLAQNRDPQLASELAADIAAEAGRLDRHIGGFLAAKPPSGSALTRGQAVGRNR